MRIAIKYDDVLIDQDGKIAGHEAADTLVRRLLRIFPGSIVIAAAARRADGFDVMPLEMLDPSDVVVINMDIADSPRVWRILRAGNRVQTPPTVRIMNFLWRALPDTASEIEMAATALSCALFPTFAGSQLSANEITDLVRRWTVQPLYQKMRVKWVNLGFRLDHIQPHRDADTPIVLYPSIYLSRHKHPDRFLAIVDKARRIVPAQVEMRLHENHLVSERAMDISSRDWVWMGPVTATRQSYWQALARTTAFVATADNVSYALAYIEALGAGVIGILPDNASSRLVVPPGYPFLYRDDNEATTMLIRALREPERCRKDIDQCAGGSFAMWIAQHHSDDAFDKAVVACVDEWFG
ncbi:glycosyltransferase [Schaalia suimastitidis]|uniref:glycosyltransferase n=1 Tax=Schaalia suimastitidis TaxID=121163 RepID=UPI00040D045F|nr:glycosyltransferase [Schaalia suimastitidis]